MYFGLDTETGIVVGMLVAGLLALGFTLGWFWGSWRETRRSAAFIVAQSQTDSVVALHAKVKVQDQLMDDFADMVSASFARLRAVETALGIPTPPHPQAASTADDHVCTP